MLWVVWEKSWIFFPLQSYQNLKEWLYRILQAYERNNLKIRQSGTLYTEYVKTLRLIESASVQTLREVLHRLLYWILFLNKNVSIDIYLTWKYVSFFLEGSTVGRLSWKFDLSSVGMTILQVVVSCPGTTYEDGQICWKICGSHDDSPQTLPNGYSFIIQFYCKIRGIIPWNVGPKFSRNCLKFFEFLLNWRKKNYI